MASKASKAMRLRQNKGVKHGTIRTGAGGKTTRRYNAGTGRWDVVAIRQSSLGGKIAGAGKDGVNAATSTGSARTSSPLASEGPKRSMGRGSSLASFANNPFGYLSAKSRASSGPVSSGRPSLGVPMRLTKSRNKTAAGRTQYRWIKAR